MDMARASMVNYRKMGLFISAFLITITNSLSFLISFISRYVFGIKGVSSSMVKKESKSAEPPPKESSPMEFCELREKKYDAFMERETPSFSFKFQYQIPENSAKVSEESQVDGIEEKTPAATMNSEIRKHRFLSEKDFSGFVEQPEPLTFSVHESYIDQSLRNSISEKLENVVFSPRDSDQSSKKDVERKVHRSFESNSSVASSEKKFSKKERVISAQTEAIEFGSWEFSGFDSDSESSWSDGYSVKNLIVDSDSDGFLSEGDFGDDEHQSYTSEISTCMSSNRYKGELLEDIRILEQAHLQSLYNSDAESIASTNGYPKSPLNHENIFQNSSSFGADIIGLVDGLSHHDESSEPISELNERDAELGEASNIESNTEDRFSLSSELLSPKSSTHIELILDSKNSEELNQIDEPKLEEEVCKVDEEKKSPTKDVKESEKCFVEGKLYDEEEEEDELESLWEHQELIEQLKMELKKVKSIGLPTILEESESPKTMEDLKPWKIEEKFSREDPMDELHKFYKSYRERMRKLDILNYQKMYAIGFLQLKDPLKSMGVQKPLLPAITSLVIQNILPFCRRKSGSDPSEKFIRELHSDLETIYVGQTCLSWEFLRWQYEKARELPESDPYRSHQYNQVAGEFQQLQVMMQRFLENESFQGPRLANYVKNRCVLRNLLQVPVIKEDCLKDKMEERRKGNNAITSEILEDIMEESIGIFWEFVKADKDETPEILKGLIVNQVELQDPSDSSLLVGAHKILQKKEKRLKDLLRTGNCLVKRFKKPQEDRSNQDLFFSQVDLKLVARVLKMSRLSSDQLGWCHKKLGNIIFLDRKLHREPSFLLFPC